MPDKLLLKNMVFHGYHGVGLPEKEFGQTFIVDLSLELDLELAGRSDDLKDTIDYSVIFSLVRDIVTGESRDLLESVADTIASNLLNVYLNAGLIFGSSNLIKLLEELSLGWLLPLWSWIEFPELGVKGAAIATSISSAWLFFHYFIRYLLPVIYSNYSKTYYIDRKVLRRLIQLCTPIGAQLIIVHAGFVIFMKLVAKIGTIELDATEIIFVIASASFMPAAGLGQACATTIGKLLGRNNHQKAYLSVFETMRMTSVFMGVMGIIFFLFPQNILSFFTNNQIVIDAGSLSLKVLGLLQIFDAMSQTLWFSLNGAGDTKFPAITEILIMWLIFLPGCWYFVTILEVELVYLWLNFSFYLILMTFILYLRIRSGKWMKIKV